MNNATAKTTTAPTTPNVLQSLRSLIPERVATFTESLRIAEIQASWLRQLLDRADAPEPRQVIAALPHIHIEYVSDLPSGGLTFWDGQQWVIQLSTLQTPVRQRHSLFHQYKHIIDHGAVERLYGGDRRHNSDAQAEQAADHFAECALIPDRALIRADRAVPGAPPRPCTWLVTPAKRQTSRRTSRRTHNRRSATSQTAQIAGTS